jgi:2'-5' RNA ligase
MSDTIFHLILARRLAQSLERAAEIIREDPNSLRHQQNLAHAHLFLAHVTSARQIYEQHCEKTLEDGTTWQKRILQDFALMRKAGLKHPIMDNITRQFSR